MVDSDVQASQLGDDIGAKINQLRLAKGFSQRKLAKLAGVTNTTISAIERNKVSPSVNTLHTILQVLESDLPTFFSQDWQKNSNKLIVRPHELVELAEPNSGVSLKQVFNNSPKRNLGFLIEEYQPHSSTEEKIMHEGEEIGTVISGEIVMRVSGQIYHLKAGDSYVIDTGNPHTFMNPTDEVARIVSAHTPATY